MSEYQKVLFQDVNTQFFKLESTNVNLLSGLVCLSDKNVCSGVTVGQIACQTICEGSFTQMIKSLESASEINYFIQQGCIKLTKSDSKFNLAYIHFYTFSISMVLF